MKKMLFSYGFLNHNCFQQDKMRKEQIKIVPSLLAFECMAGKSSGTHTCWAKMIFVDARRAENRAVELSHGTLGTLEENILKESYGFKNNKNEIRWYE